MPDDAVKQAIAFLRDRILAAAAEKHVTLSDAEVRLLSWSEVSGMPDDAEVVSEVDEKAYEAKITRLIKTAYKGDIAQGMKAEWKAHSPE